MDVLEARLQCLKHAIEMHGAGSVVGNAGDGGKRIVTTAEIFAAFVIPPTVESQSQRAKGKDEDMAAKMSIPR